MNITAAQIFEFLKRQFKTGDVVIKLIFVNLGVYLSLKIIGLTEWLLRLENSPIQTFISEWFYLPPHAQALLLKPYTLLTYQFIHDSFWHLLVNILMLFFLGR